MANVSNSGTVTEADVKNAGVADASDAAHQPVTPSSGTALVPPTQSKWYRWRQDGATLVKYLLDSEVHTFAFSVAANAILSFIPFIVLLYTLGLTVFHSKTMVDVVTDMVKYYLPATTSSPDWVANNIKLAAAVSSRHGIQVFSLIMILISCTGIFLPLEVALNQAWGVAKSRNYLLNQAVAFGLAILMVILGMTSIVLSAGQRVVLAFLFFQHTDNFFYNAISYIWLGLCSGAACILFLFSIYWLLPNCKVPARPVLRASIVTGLIWLGSRYIFVAVLPHLDLKALYGPFFVSVGLLFWAYVSGLILFAGAQYSVARLGQNGHREK